MFIGVDVGSGSARAALVDKTGKILKIAVHPIKTFNPQVNFYEQSSDDIWLAVCLVVKVRKTINKKKKKSFVQQLDHFFI